MTTGIRWTEDDLQKHLAGKAKGQLCLGDVVPRPRRQIPQQEDGMNGLEARYAREVLDIRKMAGEIVSYRFGSVKLRLAKRTWYTPDFFVLVSGEWFPWIEVHETKGHWEDDARVKIKMAAEIYREYRFIAVQHKKGIWVYEEIKP